jgi:hypothetical protein
MLKNLLDIQSIILFPHLELIQIFKEPLIILILLKECIIINGNLELHIPKHNGIILLKILYTILSLNLIKILKIPNKI